MRLAAGNDELELAKENVLTLGTITSLVLIKTSTFAVKAITSTINTATIICTIRSVIP